MVHVAEMVDQAGRVQDAAEVLVVVARSTSRPGHVESDRPQEPRGGPSDPAGAHDQGAPSRHPGRLPVAPAPRALQRLGLVEALVVGHHARQDVFGDGTVEDAAGVGDQDVGVAQLVEEQLVDTGGGDVHPAQRVRGGPGRGQGVGEDVPYQQDLRAGQRVGEGVGRARAHVGEATDLVERGGRLDAVRGEHDDGGPGVAGGARVGAAVGAAVHAATVARPSDRVARSSDC